MVLSGVGFPRKSLSIPYDSTNPYSFFKVTQTDLLVYTCPDCTNFGADAGGLEVLLYIVFL